MCLILLCTRLYYTCTSSSGVDDHDDKIMPVLSLFAARAVAHSPSGCAIRCIADGERRIGVLT